MPFVRPTLTELVDRISSDIQSKVESSSSLLRRSVLKILAKVYAGAIHLLYSYLGYQSEQLFASTAEVENLEAIGAEYGITRKAATKAIGIAVATGTDGTVIPEDTELQSDADEIYLVDEDTTISGSTNISLTAQIAGTDGNEDASTVLTFVSPIVGVNLTATVDSDGLIDGTDEESDDLLRQRILLRKQYPPYGGNQYDYENWMLEYSGVTRAWSFPLYQGAGTVGCAFVQDNNTPYIPVAATIALVRAYLVEHTDPATGRTVGIPVTAENGLFMITLTEQTLNFSLKIYPNTTAVQNDIEDELESLILREGGPGETIRISDVQAALSSVSSLQYFLIIAPTGDTVAESNKIHALGTLTYADY